MAAKEPVPEKTRSPWSPWDSCMAEPPSPTAEVVTVEMGSDDDDEVQPPPLDAPELNLDEDVAGGNIAELPKDRPGGGGEDGTVDASPLAPPTAARRARAKKGGWPWVSQPTLLLRMGSRRPRL